MQIKAKNMRARKVTIRDIATEAGVSIALVSFVMNNKDGKEGYRVNKETAQRILEIADKLNYRPNNAARILRSGQSRTIGVILSDISNKFFADIARCIEDGAYNNKYTVLFGSTDENPQKLRNLIEVFTDKGVDGLIIVPCEGAGEMIRDIVQQQQIPVVLLDREVPGVEVSSVVLNNRRAAFRLAEELLSRGYRRIEMVSYSMELSNIQEREAGYLAAMTGAGLEKSAAIHHLRHDRMNRIGDAIREAKERGVEAFLFATNSLALAGLTAIVRSGWRVPQDLAIACFDTDEMFDIYDTTTAYVQQPIERFGSEALELLIKHIEEKDVQSCTRVVLQPKIVADEYAAAETCPTKTL